MEGSQNDNSFDLYDATGDSSRRGIFLNDVNFQWNATDKNISITRKLDTAPLHEISFCLTLLIMKSLVLKYILTQLD